MSAQATIKALCPAVKAAIYTVMAARRSIDTLWTALTSMADNEAAFKAAGELSIIHTDIYGAEEQLKALYKELCRN